MLIETGENISIYKGNTEISEIYRGSDLIWAKKNYENEYFTLEILTGGTVTWSASSVNAPTLQTFQYSKNNGSWTNISTGGTINVNRGDLLRFKGNNGAYGNNTSYWHFGGTAYFKAFGNTMSLQYGDNFSGKTTFSSSVGYIFKCLFENTNVINAKHLILPVTNLSNNVYAYSQMFDGCSSLTSAPSLPATVLSIFCYMAMFRGCTNLVAPPPSLPAQTLTKECYFFMFSGCSNLKYLKCLATDISAEDCTAYWFWSTPSPTGTFVKAASMNDWTSGSSGIPSGWTVINE